MTRKIPRNQMKRGVHRTLSGDALWKMLGFNNVRAFQRARQRQQVPIRMYPVPGTRGVFAYLEDVERYLAERQALESEITATGSK